MISCYCSIIEPMICPDSFISEDAGTQNSFGDHSSSLGRSVKVRICIAIWIEQIKRQWKV